MNQIHSFSNVAPENVVRDGTRLNVTINTDTCTHNVAAGEPVSSAYYQAPEIPGSAYAAQRKPVGPFDDFTGPWQPGDRDPSAELAILHPEWFLNYPGKAPNPTYSTVGDTPLHTVNFELGGVTVIGNDGSKPSTRKVHVKNCAVGLTAYLLGQFEAGDKVPVELASEGDAGNVSGTFALSTEKGPRVGPSIIQGQAVTGNTASLNITITPELAGKDIYLNAEYVSANADQIVQVGRY